MNKNGGASAAQNKAINQESTNLVSIVTPSFRQTRLLDLACQSVADQQGEFAKEHLVQEGYGGEEFECWASVNRHVSIEVGKDRGMYDAINRGFARSNGDFVAWLNCDEQYLPGTLAKVTKWFEDHPDCDLLFGDTILVSNLGVPIAYRKAIVPNPKEIQHCFLSTYSAATFVRRRILDEGSLLEDRFKAIADAVWIHGLLGKGYRAGVLNEPLAAFLQDGSNLGQSPEGLLEGIKWRRHDTLKGRLLKLLWIQIFRLRKLFHGCYLRKEVQTGIFQDGKVGRQPLVGSVGGFWKRQ